LTPNVTKDVRGALYSGAWDKVDKAFQDVLDKKATCEEDTILFALERVQENNWNKTPNVCKFIFF
jgi:hypothetical protein